MSKRMILNCGFNKGNQEICKECVSLQDGGSCFHLNRIINRKRDERRGIYY